MQSFSRLWVRCGLFAACMLALAHPASSAPQACSRPIIVPASALGASFIVKDQTVSGVFPDLLREIGPRSGCRFEFVVVPRVRAEFMTLKAATADLLVPASRTSERDQVATFVALTVARPTMYSLKSRVWEAASLQELLASPALRAVSVRSYSWGDNYRDFLDALQAQRRLEFVADVDAAVRMVLAGRADFTIVAPSQIAALREQQPGLAGGLSRLGANALSDLPPIESGAYISKLTLSAQDQAHLRQVLLDAVRNGDFKRANERHNAREILRGSPAPRTERP